MTDDIKESIIINRATENQQRAIYAAIRQDDPVPFRFYDENNNPITPAEYEQAVQNGNPPKLLTYKK